VCNFKQADVQVASFASSFLPYRQKRMYFPLFPPPAKPVVLLLAFAFLILSPPVFLYAGDEAVRWPLPKDKQLIDLTSDRYTRLFAELRGQYSFTPQQLATLFTGLRIKKQVIDLMNRPGENKPYYQYRDMFVTQAIIETGRGKMRENKTTLDRIERELGVDRQFVIAIWGVETQFGQNTGNFNVFQVLNTLFDAYPRRSDFFRQELIEFLLLCREIGVDPRTIRGSYAGAFGQTQFMPSSFRRYALSFAGKSHPDVFNSTPDILVSIANYLKHFGWRFRAPLYADIGGDLQSLPLIKAYQEGRKGRVSWRQVVEGQKKDIPKPADGGGLAIVGLEAAGGGLRYVAAYGNYQAIVAWNNSNRYAMVVTELAEAIAKPAILDKKPSQRFN
jgi:membrane-bound lytic murein transglycosylase B